MSVPCVNSQRKCVGIVLLLLLTAAGGCASDTATGSAGAGGIGVGGAFSSGGSIAGPSTGGSISGLGGGSNVGIPVGTAGSGGGGGALTEWPPAGYINVTDTTVGAYALGPDISSGNVTAPGVCAGLFGIVRDFKMGSQAGGHPDFETAPTAVVKGIVLDTLGADGKPVYAKPSGTTVGTSGQANFDQWYNDTPEVNKTYILGLKVVAENGISTFSALKGTGVGQTSSSFFPLDGQGFGNEGEAHNFSFTTEIHTSFTYKGGETFTFKGDDDVWVFIDKKLVIDLGGRHAQETGTVSVDTLGLSLGTVYDLAIFHAERHTSESNFQIQTTLAFADCGQVNGVLL